MGCVIRRATRSDIPEMFRLWREMMDFHAQVEPRFRPLPPPEGERAWEVFLTGTILDGEDWCVLVAEQDGRLIGQIMGGLRDYAPVFVPDPYGYVTDIVVDPTVRRNGVGEALFAELESWFREQGVSHLQLNVAHHNLVSQAFWRAMGCTDYMDTMWYDLEAE